MEDPNVAPSLSLSTCHDLIDRLYLPPMIIYQAFICLSLVDNSWPCIAVSIVFNFVKCLKVSLDVVSILFFKLIFCLKVFVFNV